MNNSLAQTANNIALSTHSQLFVSVQLKADWAQHLRKDTKANVFSEQYSKAFPNGLYKLTGLTGEYGKTTYETRMQNATSNKDFKAQKASGRTSVKGLHNVTVADKNEDQFYLSLNLVERSVKHAKTCFIDSIGNTIEESKIEAFNALFKASGIPSKIKIAKAKAKAYRESKMQEIAGNEDVNTFFHIAPKFETVQYLKAGENMYGKKITVN